MLGKLKTEEKTENEQKQKCQQQKDKAKEEKRWITGIIKVIMFLSESCAIADEDVNAQTIKMQITGLGGFGK